MIKKNFFDFFFILSLFIFDRISKILAINSYQINSDVENTILPFLSFNLIWNEGIAFGLFSFDQNFRNRICTKKKKTDQVRLRVSRAAQGAEEARHR